MNSDYRIAYWLKGLSVQNFGDFLSELLFSKLSAKSRTDADAGQFAGNFDSVHLIGSVIADSHIKKDLEHARVRGRKKIAYWCCGKRDEKPLDPDLQDKVAFFGIRGPLSRDALGLPARTTLGDPALLLPLLYTPRRVAKYAAKSVCVPHFLETKTDSQLLRETGVDFIVRPNIAADMASLFAFIDKVVSAKFVLCGALHATILRCAYEKSYAYYNSGYIDVPFKWRDFAASVGVGSEFASNLRQGQALYRQTIEGRMSLPPLDPILACAPIIAAPALRARAQRWDRERLLPE